MTEMIDMTFDTYLDEILEERRQSHLGIAQLRTDLPLKYQPAKTLTSGQRVIPLDDRCF